MKILPTLSLNEQDYFWNLVDITSSNVCWNWLGYILESGYGQITLAYTHYRVHRLAYWLQHQIQPGDQLICHTCDNRCCCNPRHLFLGNNADNSSDMVAKGRVAHQQGIKHGGVKLTEPEVLLIRKSHDSGVWLAQKFGVSPPLICMIRNHKIWKHLL